MSSPIIIATRGSALALAQSNHIRSEVLRHFPELAVELKIIKTTGDKLQTASPQEGSTQLGKGLFTKELEVAMLGGQADFAVHSLKDLPTELPAGLALTAVPPREEPWDVLISRAGISSVQDLPQGATVATSSTRRQAQLLALRPDLKLTAIRGNVGTRLEKLARNPELHGLILALAGLKRLGFRLEHGTLHGPQAPPGLVANVLGEAEMLPCVGQAALGIESRAGDDRILRVVEALNHAPSHQCVLAERAFLRGMGGGCLSPVGALARIHGDELTLKAVSFRDSTCKRGALSGPVAQGEALGLQLSEMLR